MFYEIGNIKIVSTKAFIVTDIPLENRIHFVFVFILTQHFNHLKRIQVPMLFPNIIAIDRHFDLFLALKRPSRILIVFQIQANEMLI